jgi:hypothetical protein
MHPSYTLDMQITGYYNIAEKVGSAMGRRKAVHTDSGFPKKGNRIEVNPITSHLLLITLCINYPLPCSSCFVNTDFIHPNSPLGSCTYSHQFDFPWTSRM